MTREEAITYLNVIWNRYKAEYEIERETLDAYHMAIEALQAEYEDYEHATLVDIKEPLKVSVVRCKDCIYKCLYDYDDDEPEYYYCALEDRPNRNWSVDDTDYCSWGERREE